MPSGADQSQNFEIAGASIAPGERMTIAIPVSHQVTGLNASLALQVINGRKSGPTVFVSAAIHGDEVIGTGIVRRVIGAIEPDELCGTLILAPAVNIYGLMQHSRYLPDRRDLNRSFPGTLRGSLASQLAHAFLTNVIDRCTLGIDLHSAAVNRYNLPQIRIAAGSPYLVELAMAFGAPIIIESPLRDGSMRALAHERETPMLLLEAGEALRFDRLSLEIGTAGVLNVLAHIGMLQRDDGMANPVVPVRANNSRWVRAPRGGVTQRARKSGDAVRTGDILGVVTGLFGESPESMVSPVDGLIIGHATLPIVYQGDAIFHIAEVDNPYRAGQTASTISEAILASEPAGPAHVQLDEDELTEDDEDEPAPGET